MPSTQFYQMEELIEVYLFLLLNEANDSLQGIVELGNENVLASRGGGIGSYWGNLRGTEKSRPSWKTSGGAIRVMDPDAGN